MVEYFFCFCFFLNIIKHGYTIVLNSISQLDYINYSLELSRQDLSALFAADTRGISANMC